MIQDKDHEVTILDRKEYIEKCLNIWNIKAVVDRASAGKTSKI